MDEEQTPPASSEQQQQQQQQQQQHQQQQQQQQQEQQQEVTISGETVRPASRINKKINRPILRQTLTSLSPIMATIAIGSTFGYSAILLPQLKSHPAIIGANFTATSNDSVVHHSWMQNNNNNNNNNNSVNDNFWNNEIRLNSIEEESWIAASAVILMAPGCWLSGYLMDKIGRKKSQILIGPIYLMAWLGVGLSPNYWALIMARIISGFCVGLQSPLGPVYVAEITDPRLRGLLLSCISLAIAVGILISHVLGTWLSWRVAAHIATIFPTLCFIFSIFSPESPAWLLNNNRITEARDSWIYLRGDYSNGEFSALEESAAENKLKSASTDTLMMNFHLINKIKSPRFLKPFIIMNVFFFTSQFSGVNAVAFYSVQMISEISDDPSSTGQTQPHYVTLILDVIRVAASVAACWLTRRYPRRVLALVSGFGSAICLLGLCVSLTFNIGRQWLPASLLIAYTSLVFIGLVPLPWLLCGEIFPADLRGLGSGLSSGFAFISFFIVIKTGPGMIRGFGINGTFLFYAIITALGTVFLYFYLPETKNKTLKEIEENFTGNQSKESRSNVAVDDKKREDQAA